MSEPKKSCTLCEHSENKYEFGHCGRITFFCYCCMMDGRNKFIPKTDDRPKGADNDRT